MHKPIALLAVCSLGFTMANAQNTVAFSVTQPPQFVVDAGSDITFPTQTSVGGSPTATGGGGWYGYQWSPAVYLSDPSSPNPTVQGLTEQTTFTVEVWDAINNCIKVDQVVVNLLSTGVGLSERVGLKIFPNPSNGVVNVECNTPIHRIGLRSLSGQLLMEWDLNGDASKVLSTSGLSEGIYFLNIVLTNGTTITEKLCSANSGF